MPSDTVVLQSYRTIDVPAWISTCMGTVRSWTQDQGWHYACMGDEFLSMAPPWARQQCGHNLYAITDLSRLLWIQQVLSDPKAPYRRAIWVDADVLVMNPQALGKAVSACEDHALARELFMKTPPNRGISFRHGVNNAFMVFDRGSPMPERYMDACWRQLRATPSGEVERTALGPAILQSLHRQSPIRLIDGIGLYTPGMMHELAQGEGTLYQRYLCEWGRAPLAANLCHFMRNATPQASRPNFDAIYARAIARLLCGP